MKMEPILKNRLQVISNPNSDLWESFILAHPYGNIFQHPAMWQLYNSVNTGSAGVLSVADEEGDITGILVYTILHEPGSKKVFTQRAVIHGGPLVRENDPALIRRLLSAYERQVSTLGIIYTEIRNQQDTLPLKSVFEEQGYQFSDHLNIYIDLSKPEDQLREDVHWKRMANIRRAAKKGIFSREIKTDEEISIAYNLIKKTYQRINLPLPPADLFLNAGHYLHETVKIYGAFSGDRMIGARVYLLFRHTVYDWYAGSDEDYFNLHPNDILPWDMMCFAKKSGFSIYDFGGAGRPDKSYGVRTYKERFGGQTVNRGRYTKVHRPLLYRLGKFALKYYKFFRYL